jgi:hypothetical protein
MYVGVSRENEAFASSFDGIWCVCRLAYGNLER